MKKLFIFYFVLFLFGCKEETADPNLVKSFSISSSETGRNYTISVRLPEDYHLSSNTYPTMYVLDAEQNEEFVAKTTDKVSRALNTQNVIVVGIRSEKYSDRNIDYTPTATSHGQGGGGAFVSFIKNELIPRIHEDYRADTLRSKRSIMGHSYGGLLGAYAFVQHNEVFGNYLLLSTSMFYDSSVILKYEQQNRPFLNNTTQLVFLGAGSTEKDLLLANDLLYRRLTQFYLQTKSTLEFVPGRGHLTSKNTSIENAIQFYFRNR